MSNQVASKQTINIVPVQGVFGPEPDFTIQQFIGPAGTPFFAPVGDEFTGKIILGSTIDSSVIGGTAPAAGAFTNVAMASGTILATPQADNDIANKNYVDSVAQGLNVRAACVYATVSNITLSGLGLQAGGEWIASLSEGDRVLVKNQTLTQNNGIYSASANGWQRVPDMNTWAEVPSSFVFIQRGSTYADTGWVCTSDPGGTINVTPITWTQFSGAGYANYLAGHGLELTDNVFSVKPNGATLSVSGLGVKISDTYAGQATITTVGTITSGTWNAGTIAVGRGGTGATTLTGYVKGNGVSAFTASATVPTTDLSGLITNLQLQNRTISGIALGSNLAALTIGTGLSGTSYNGSTAVTIANTAPMVYPGAGIPSSTGTAWGTSYTVTGTGTAVALQTSASLTTPNLSAAKITGANAFVDWSDIQAPSYLKGRMWYDSDTNALAYYNNITGNSVHIGQELQQQVRNSTGATIAKGTAVYISGATGQIANITRAQANAFNTSLVIGVANQDIPDNAIGYVVTIGTVTNVDTGAFADGDDLFLSPTVAGGITNILPTNPNYAVQVGICLYANNNNGKIWVYPQYLGTNASNVVGTMTVAQGGTNSASTPTPGAVAYGTGSAYAFTAAGATGQVLQSNGASAPTWVTPVAYVAVTDDTTTNANRYPLFANQTAGNLATTYTSSTKLQFNPSTGVLTATGGTGGGTF